MGMVEGWFSIHILEMLNCALLCPSPFICFSIILIIWIFVICRKSYCKKNQWEKSNQIIERILIFLDKLPKLRSVKYQDARYQDVWLYLTMILFPVLIPAQTRNTMCPHLIIKFSSVCWVNVSGIKNPEFPEAPIIIKQSKKSNFIFVFLIF